jgi:predicted nucleic acid-binding protein
MSAPRPLFVAEPPSVWHARPPVVVDCSVLVSHLFEEEDAQQAADAMQGRALHAPALLPFEFANVARSKSRAGAPAERVRAALADFDELRIEVRQAPARALHDLALACDLSAYDAAYLWLAAELDAPLLTFDRRLALAAQRHLGARG